MSHVAGTLNMESKRDWNVFTIYNNKKTNLNTKNAQK